MLNDNSEQERFQFQIAATPLFFLYIGVLMTLIKGITQQSRAMRTQKLQKKKPTRQPTPQRKKKYKSRLNINHDAIGSSTNQRMKKKYQEYSDDDGDDEDRLVHSDDEDGVIEQEQGGKQATNMGKKADAKHAEKRQLWVFRIQFVENGLFIGHCLDLCFNFLESNKFFTTIMRYH
jgi:hypothetical protein